MTYSGGREAGGEQGPKKSYVFFLFFMYYAPFFWVIMYAAGLGP